MAVAFCFFFGSPYLEITNFAFERLIKGHLTFNHPKKVTLNHQGHVFSLIVCGKLILLKIRFDLFVLYIPDLEGERPLGPLLKLGAEC